MPTGKVKFFNEDRGYGFITNDEGGADAFVHITAVEAAGLKTLSPDQQVSYDMERDKKGKEAAANLKLAD